MKPKYEAPRIISLSDMNATQGEHCQTGAGALANCGGGEGAQGACSYGNVALYKSGKVDCVEGISPGVASACSNGHTAGSACSIGWDAGVGGKRSCSQGYTARGGCDFGNVATGKCTTGTGGS